MIKLYKSKNKEEGIQNGNKAMVEDLVTEVIDSSRFDM